MRIRLALFVCLLSLNIFASDQTDFNEALGKYEKLHDAFFKNDLKSVHKYSTELAQEISEINNKEVKKKLSYTLSKLAELEKTSDIDAAKKNMNIVSQGILVVLEKDLPNKDYARYYCPMVKKYWIQNVSKVEKVHNPYASESMPHCGERK